MVVKDKVGRRRYIIVQNSPDLQKVLKNISKHRNIQFILSENGYSIIRCKHWYKDELIRLLQNNGVMTYHTTGTIKSAKQWIQENGSMLKR